MNNIEFSEILLNNIYIYISCLLLSLFTYLILLKKYYNSILDPFFLCITISAISSAIPFFLFFTGHCNLKYFIYFIFAKTAFWSGFAINHQKNNSFNGYIINKEEKISYNLYLIFYILSIILKICSYALLGIPLLLNNRQDIYLNANGLAIIDKISSPICFYCIVYSFYVLKRKPLISYIYIIFTIIIGILGGGKGFILNICAAFFIYKIIYKQEKITIPIHILIIIILSPILILLISGFSSNFYMAIYDYMFRIVAYGDVYWYSFPNSTIEQIKIVNPISHLFSGVLGPLRLIDYNIDGIPIGRLLYWETMPKEYHDVMGGPNARPVVLSYILFKYFGIFICYYFGYLMAFFMTHIKRFLPEGIISSIIIGFIYVYFKDIATDPVMAFNGIFAIFLFLSTLLFFLFLTNKKYTLKKIDILKNRNKKNGIFHLKIIVPFIFFIISVIMELYYN